MSMGFLDNLEHILDEGLSFSEEKVNRNIAGDSLFVEKNYHDTINLFISIRPMISPEVYNAMVHGFANIFSEDNPRFDADRFLEDLK